MNSKKNKNSKTLKIFLAILAGTLGIVGTVVLTYVNIDLGAILICCAFATMTGSVLVNTTTIENVPTDYKKEEKES